MSDQYRRIRRAKLLAIGMTWNPHWRAEIDDWRTRLLRLPHSQMGIEIPSGDRVVGLCYMSAYFPLILSFWPALCLHKATTIPAPTARSSNRM